MFLSLFLSWRHNLDEKLRPVYSGISMSPPKARHSGVSAVHAGRKGNQTHKSICNTFWEDRGQTVEDQG